ncbi:MAG: hypothetical protein CM1200mP26_03090 [Acidimicrobiales bacterium]|nr:MAG: hypothetical protein CM1200mP26_03090 [Acidimicrobiales bacterium]
MGSVAIVVCRSSITSGGDCPDRSLSRAPPPVGSVPLTTEGGVHEFTQLAELCEALAEGWATGRPTGPIRPRPGRCRRCRRVWLSMPSGGGIGSPSQSCFRGHVRRPLTRPDWMPCWPCSTLPRRARFAAVALVLNGLIAHLVGLAGRLSQWVMLRPAGWCAWSWLIWRTDPLTVSTLRWAIGLADGGSVTPGNRIVMIRDDGHLFAWCSGGSWIW